MRNIVFASVAVVAAFSASSLIEGQGCCSGMGGSQQKENAAVTAKTEKGVQRASVKVQNGGYSPGTINVDSGKPVELAFRLGENPGCGDVLVIKELKFKKSLSSSKDTLVKFTPKKKGTIEFTCGMGMYRGKIVVR